MASHTFKTTIVLELTPQEAIWLEALLRNPVGDPDNEDGRDREMRMSIFDALPSESTINERL